MEAFLKKRIYSDIAGLTFKNKFHGNHRSFDFNFVCESFSPVNRTNRGEKVQSKIKPEVKHKRKNKMLSAPVFLSAASGDIGGEINLIWEPVPNANSYIIQKSTGSFKQARWVNLDIVAKSSHTVSRLISGHYYRFRVAAVTVAGRSNWSNLVKKKAP